MKFFNKDKAPEEKELKLLKILEVSNDDSAMPVDLMDKPGQYIIRCNEGKLKSELFRLGSYDDCFECREQEKCINYAERCSVYYHDPFNRAMRGLKEKIERISKSKNPLKKWALRSALRDM